MDAVRRRLRPRRRRDAATTPRRSRSCPTSSPPERLSRANSRLYAVELTANQFVGPPLGGLLAAAALAGALAASALGYALAAIALVAARRPVPPGPSDGATRLRTDIAEGVRYLARHRLLRTLALCVGSPTWRRRRRSPSSRSTPSTPADGAVGGRLRPAPRDAGRRRARRLVLRRAARAASRPPPDAAPRRGDVPARSSLVPAVTADAWLIAVAFFVGSALTIGWNVITVSLRQRIVPDHLLGRVNAGYRLLAWGTMPLGAALGGLIGERWGVDRVLDVRRAERPLPAAGLRRRHRPRARRRRARRAGRRRRPPGTRRTHLVGQPPSGRLPHVLIRRETVDDVEAIDAVHAAAFARPGLAGPPPEVALVRPPRRRRTGPGALPGRGGCRRDRRRPRRVHDRRGRRTPRARARPARRPPRAPGPRRRWRRCTLCSGPPMRSTTSLWCCSATSGTSPRSGFPPAESLGISAPDPARGEHFQARPLSAWSPAITGVFRYAAPFDAI